MDDKKLAEQKKTRYTFLIVTGVVLALVIFLLAFLCGHLGAESERAAIDKMRSYALSVKETVNASIRADEDIVAAYAERLGRMDGLVEGEMQVLLASFRKTERIVRLELLLPGNIILSDNGQKYEASGVLSYDKEIAKGIHVTGRDVDFMTGAADVVRVCVPVYQKGQKVALLCGLVKTEAMKDAYPKALFDEEDTYFYIIEGDTSKIIVSTTGESPDNIYDWSGRTIKGGGTILPIKEDLENLREGHFTFKEDYLRPETEVYYTPLDLNQWDVAVFVDSSELYASFRSKDSFVIILLCTGIAALLAYVVWVGFFFSKESRSKQKQLDTVSYIYGVEKMLFSAHQKKERVQEALREIAKLTESEMAFYALHDVSNPSEEPLYFVNDKSYSQVIKRFLTSNEFFVDVFSRPDQEVCNADYVVIPILDTDDVQIGVLGTSGGRSHWQTSYILKQVSMSFSMLGMNIRTYDMIKEMGEVDALTGVMNRNCFESRQDAYGRSARESVGVIYVDVNGLHELNNTQGHEAGDAMLRYVANVMSNTFGRTDTFRMGGDEFVAVVTDEFEDVIKEKIIHVEDEMVPKGYHVAVGMAYGAIPIDMNKLTKCAETLMFDAKSRYYQSLGNDRRRR